MESRSNLPAGRIIIPNVGLGPDKGRRVGIIIIITYSRGFNCDWQRGYTDN